MITWLHRFIPEIKTFFVSFKCYDDEKDTSVMRADYYQDN